MKLTDILNEQQINVGDIVEVQNRDIGRIVGEITEIEPPNLLGDVFFEYRVEDWEDHYSYYLGKTSQILRVIKRA